MAIKYVKNCTGSDCGERGALDGKSSALISRVIFFVLLVGFIGVTAYVLLFSTYLQIVNVTVSGTQDLNSSDIVQKVDGMLQEKYFGVIPKNNFMFVSQKKVSDVLTGDFKKIRTVTVVKKFPDTVSINIDERKALLIWCSSENCYLLDENGTAYLQADFNSPEIIQNNLLKIADTSAREVVIGENVVNQSYEKFVLGLKDTLQGAGFTASGEYSTPSRMAEEIRVKTTQGSEIYFSTQFPLDSSMQALSAVVKKEITDDKKNDLEYIDLRNENKVFYKFKNAQPVVEGTQNNSSVVKK